MAPKKSSPAEDGAPAGVTPQLEIAWARAISRAVDDPAFGQRLAQDPPAALAELGVTVPEGIDVATDLSPTLESALPAIEQYRTAQQAVAAAYPVASAAPGYVHTASVAQPAMVAAPMGTASLAAQPAMAYQHTASAPMGLAHPAASAPMAFAHGPTASAPYAPPAASWACAGYVMAGACYSAPGACYCAACRGAVSGAPMTPAPDAPQWLGGPPSAGTW